MPNSIGAIDTGKITVSPGRGDALLHLSTPDRPDYRVAVGTPEWTINGQKVSAFVFEEASDERVLPRGGGETILRFLSKEIAGLELAVTLRYYAGSPFVRFRYQLRTDGPTVRLSKLEGQDALRYLAVSVAHDAPLTEIQLSHWDDIAHSYLPHIQTFAPSEQYEKQAFGGPIVLREQGDMTLLLAYEHGATEPHHFLEFALTSELGNVGAESRLLTLSAAKGNYYDGQIVSGDAPFTSVWFEVGLMPGTPAELLPRYRQFFLDEAAENVESRKPYVYYNTWNWQERDKYFDGQPYLSRMNLAKILAEIDAAHEIGIEVFVIDTGWYGKTGDWQVSLERFPDGLRDVKARLDGYGMKLGLWFNPIVAAQTSDVYVQHPEYVMQKDGKPNFWGEIWETEGSYGMCLASGYSDHFIETLVRLNRELGVVYFKWDAIGQWGCDGDNHDHGTAENTTQERADCYAYESGRQMIRIVEEVSRRCPDVIVDFDVTEGGRFVGLGFLSVGKFFLVNNGPYFHNFDIPRTTKIDPDTINVFFYPGPARARVCRTGLLYDAIVPSILFLTHYLPDGPALSQRNSLCALMLGGNGLWGDLTALTAEDKSLLAAHLADYKQVRETATRVAPRGRGFKGSTPEVIEKLDPIIATGLVVFFTSKACRAVYVTQPLDVTHLGQIKGADTYEILPDGRVRLTAQLQENDAIPVYFLPS